MDNAHEKHLDQLLNKFFLLEKVPDVAQLFYCVECLTLVISQCL